MSQGETRLFCSLRGRNPQAVGLNLNQSSPALASNAIDYIRACIRFHVLRSTSRHRQLILTRSAGEPRKTLAIGTAFRSVLGHWFAIFICLYIYIYPVSNSFLLLVVMASNLLAIASNLEGIASNLVAYIIVYMDIYIYEI